MKRIIVFVLVLLLVLPLLAVQRKVVGEVFTATW